MTWTIFYTLVLMMWWLFFTFCLDSVVPLLLLLSICSLWFRDVRVDWIQTGPEDFLHAALSTPTLHFSRWPLKSAWDTLTVSFLLLLIPKIRRDDISSHKHNLRGGFLKKICFWKFDFIFFILKNKFEPDSKNEQPTHFLLNLEKKDLFAALGPLKPSQS